MRCAPLPVVRLCGALCPFELTACKNAIYSRVVKLLCRASIHGNVFVAGSHLCKGAFDAHFASRLLNKNILAVEWKQMVRKSVLSRVLVQFHPQIYAVVCSDKKIAYICTFTYI